MDRKLALIVVCSLVWAPSAASFQFGLPEDEHHLVNELFGLSDKEALEIMPELTHTIDLGTVKVFRHRYRGFEVLSSEAEVLELANGDWLPHNTSKLIVGLEWYARGVDFANDKMPDAGESLEACHNHSMTDLAFEFHHGTGYKRYLYLYKKSSASASPAIIMGPLVFVDKIHLVLSDERNDTFDYFCYFDASQKQILTDLDTIHEVDYNKRRLKK